MKKVFLYFVLFFLCFQVIKIANCEDFGLLDQQIQNKVLNFNKEIEKNWLFPDKPTQNNNYKDVYEFPKTSKTKEGKVKVFLNSFISIHYDKEIIEYFLEYYINQNKIRGENIILFFHLDSTLTIEEQEKDFQIFQTFFLPLLHKYSVTKYQLWYAVFSAINLKQKEYNTLKNVLPDDSWLVRVDSDEFLSLPSPIIQFYSLIQKSTPNLVDFITMIDDFGFTFWKGHFVDRFSPDCSLQPILPFLPQNITTNSSNINSLSHSDLDYHLFSKEGNYSNTKPMKSLFEQFPCKTNLTKDLSVHNQKASIVRSLFETSVGNHCLVYESPCFNTPSTIPSYVNRFQNNAYFHSLNESNFEIFMEYLARLNNVNNFQSIRDSIYVNKSNSTLFNGGRFITYVNDFQLEVNHFKWNFSLRAKLTKRFRDYTQLKFNWAKESNNFLEYFNEDGTARKDINGCPCFQ